MGLFYRRLILIGLVAAAALCCAAPLYAGMEPSDWDYLPVITEINFTSSTVGFAAQDGRRMVFDKAAQSFRQVEPVEYAALMRGAKGGKAAWPEKNEAGDTVTLITSSAGVFLETLNKYCDDDKGPAHVLKLGGVVIKDHAAPCDNISSAEIENDRLWLGTRGFGGYGEFPGRGIVVQSLADGSHIKTISRKNGLTSDLVRVVKLDPHTGHIWTATHLGINEISPELEVLYSGYLYEDFDAEGACAVQAAEVPTRNNFVAVFGRLLGVKDKKKYYEAAMTIPPEMLTCFNVETMTGWPPGHCEAAGALGYSSLLPPQFNALAPFVIETADFSPEKIWGTVKRLCIFSDKAAAALIADHVTDEAFLSMGSYGEQCVSYYKEAGLFPYKPSETKVKAALGRISRALSRLKLSSMNGGDIPDFREGAAALDAAEGLAALGSPRGVELLNEFFLRVKAGNGDNQEVRFFSEAAQKLHYRDEFLPGAMSGVEKFYGEPVQQGCLYLDVAHPEEQKKNRAGVKQLVSLLKAVENATHPEWIPHQPSQAQGAYDTCRAAAVSQLKDKAVREEFLKNVYPGLAPAYKRVADGILNNWDIPAN